MLITSWEEKDLLARAARLVTGLFDFDGTTHEGNQWRAMDARIPQVLLDKDHAVYQQYRRFRLAPKDGTDIHTCGPQSNAHLAAWEMQWIERGMRLYAAGNLTRDDLRLAGESLTLRDGAVELFDLFEHRAVISMGIEPIIQSFLDFYGFNTPKRPVWIGASRVECDAKGRILGAELNAMPAALKKEIRAWYLRNIVRNEDPDTVFALGDSLGDRDLMEPGRGLNAFVVPFPADDANTDSYRAEHLEEIVSLADILVVGNSLKPLAELISDAHLVVP
jgi:hypothetical protein